MALEATRQVEDPDPEIPTCVAMLDIGRRLFADIRDIDLYQHQRERVQAMVMECIGLPVHIEPDGTCTVVRRLKAKMEEYMHDLVVAGVIRYDRYDGRWKQCFDEEDLL